MHDTNSSAFGLLHGSGTGSLNCEAAVERFLPGNTSAEDKRQLDKVLPSPSRIIGCDLPLLEEISNTR